MSDELAETLTQLEDLQSEFDSKAQEIADELDSTITDLREQFEKVEGVDTDSQEFEDFLEQPYTIVPKEEDEVWVIVPRFIPFNVGWLDHQDDSYNHFIVNRYVNWIEEIPDEITDKVGIDSEYDSVELEDGVLSFSSEEERDRAWDQLGGRDGGLYKRTGDTDIQIKSDSEFDVVSELIEQGNLPFKQQPIDPVDIRESVADVELRSYQERAWEKFKQTGQIGVYWPPGAGKTFIALYAGSRIDGQKLVVVPQKTLEEQWNERIQEFCEHPDEWTVKTYQYLTRGDNMKEYNDVTFTIFDESQTIPANTHSKLATIDTTYRMGLSATPYREDDRTKYVFALTGYPVGLNWSEMEELGVTEYPDVRVLLHRTKNQKQNTLEEFVEEKPGKILIFCDSIDEGKKLSSRLDVPFIHGETRDRLDQFRDNRVVISSRVGDEGLSLDDIDIVIEYDFHGRSRRQELQRAGRVMHNDQDAGEHYVLMTDAEYDKYNRRLLSLEQKGFNIQKIRKD